MFESFTFEFELIFRIFRLKASLSISGNVCKVNAKGWLHLLVFIWGSLLIESKLTMSEYFNKINTQGAWNERVKSCFVAGKNNASYTVASAILRMFIEGGGGVILPTNWATNLYRIHYRTKPRQFSSSTKWRLLIDASSVLYYRELHLSCS